MIPRLFGKVVFTVLGTVSLAFRSEPPSGSLITISLLVLVVVWLDWLLVGAAKRLFERVRDR
jgi:hypothetical protein